MCQNIYIFYLDGIIALKRRIYQHVSWIFIFIYANIHLCWFGYDEYDLSFLISKDPLESDLDEIII